VPTPGGNVTTGLILDNTLRPKTPQNFAAENATVRHELAGSLRECAGGCPRWFDTAEKVVRLSDLFPDFILTVLFADVFALSLESF
jgi:hypothetical protein